MKHKSLFIFIIVIILTLGITSTASAGGPPPVDFQTCLTVELLDGYGEGATPGTHFWTDYDESFYQDLLANPRHSWFWPGEIMGACDADSFDLLTGESLIAFLGPYTVTVQEAYRDTTLSLSRFYGEALIAIDFVRVPVIVNHDGLMGLFVKLAYDINDIALFNGFMDGTFEIFYRNGDGVWGSCPTVLMEYDLEAAGGPDFGYAQCVVWDEVTAYAVGQE